MKVSQKYYQMIQSYFATALFIFMIGCASVQTKWETAENINTIEAYENFLKRYPNSEFAAEAHSRLEQLYFEQAKSTNNPENWRYFYIVRNAHPLIPKYYAVTSYDYGDFKTGTQPLESAKIANAIYVAPSGSNRRPVGVVPNPYRANEDYLAYHGGVSWENRDDGTTEYFPQTDRRLYFYNLPKECFIRIYTVAGDLVDIVPHNVSGDSNQGWNADFAEAWDLNSRNHQQVVAGLYLFTVEDMTPEKKGDIQTGKFVVIR